MLVRLSHHNNCQLLQFEGASMGGKEGLGTYLAAKNAAGRNSRHIAYSLTIPDVFPFIVKEEGASMGGKEGLGAYLAAKNAAELRRARAGGSGANGGGSDALLSGLPSTCAHQTVLHKTML